MRRAEPPDVVLDRNSCEPLHRQIARQMADGIRSGRLGRGERLPSTRSLARLLGVSRNIVVIAYENLAADGLIRSFTVAVRCAVPNRHASACGSR